ncbi:MAG: efflux RND transporter periplasmic adaptor subunit [Gemmatimonadaceae bacterium]
MLLTRRRCHIAIALLALAANACTTSSSAKGTDSAKADSSDATASSSSLSLPVSASPARNGDLVISVATTGQVRSDGEASLKAEVAGTIDKVLVHPGDRVKQGQSLVTYDERPFKLAVEEADAAVAEAEVRYADAIVPDSIVTGKPPSPDQRRIALTRSGLQTARVRLERAKLDRERATIVSPFDGMVDRVDVAPGERVQAGEPVTRVVNLNELRIEAAVLEHDLPLIKEGGQAIVSSAAAPDRHVTGRVTAVLPMIDTVTRSGRAYVRVPGGGILRPGMYADVRLEAQRLTNRRLVPARAIIERDGRPLVFVVKDARAKWVYVTPGRSNGVETEILPDSTTGVIPVEAGDDVIVEGHLTLTHDAPVKVVQATTLTEAADANAKPVAKKP